MTGPRIKPLNLKRREALFDGLEDDALYKGAFRIPYADSLFQFTVDDFIKNKLKNLRSILGEESYAALLKKQNFEIAEYSDNPRATNGLDAYYFLRQGAAPDAAYIILISFGEFQPSRYIIDFEGIWEAKGEFK